MIKRNDVVRVWLPDEESNPASKLHGQTFIVKKRRDVTANRGARGSYYELYDAVSEYGIPYAFTEDQLIKMA